MESQNWEIIHDYLEGLKNGDVSKAKLAAGLIVKTPLNEYRSAAEFSARVSQMSKLYTNIIIRDECVDGDKATILYDIVVKQPVGIVKIVDFYWLEKGEITCIESFFDPRALLAFVSLGF